MTTLLPIQVGKKLTLIASEGNVKSLPIFYRNNFTVDTTLTGGDTLASTITVQFNYALDKYLYVNRDAITSTTKVYYDSAADSFWVDLQTITVKGSTLITSEIPTFFRLIVKTSDYDEADGNIVCQAIETELTSLSGDGGSGLTEEEVLALITTANRDQVVNKGTYNASTNTAYNLSGTSVGGLADGSGTSGFIYKVIVAGTRDFGSGPVELTVNDIIIYSDGVWNIFINATASGGGSGVSANTYEFTDIDGVEGVTITHNSGHPIIAILVLDPLEEGDDLETYLIDEQAPDGNSFTANWIGTRSGSIVYYTSSDTTGVTAHQETFANIDGETTGVTITHGTGHPIVAMLVLEPLLEGDDLEVSLVDEQDPDGNSFTARWLGVRSGSIVYYS